MICSTQQFIVIRSAQCLGQWRYNISEWKWTQLFIDTARYRRASKQRQTPWYQFNRWNGMRGEILKNALLSSDADKSLWSSYKWWRAGINKVNLNDENTDKPASWRGFFLPSVCCISPPLFLPLYCIWSVSISLPLKEIFKPIFSPLDVKLLTWNTFWGLSIIW